MKLACLHRAAWFGVPLILVSGCATSALWEEGTFASYHEPASPPNLQLFQSDRQKAVLVRYDEASETSDAIKSRAYWLRGNERPVPNPHKPRFVSTHAAHGLPSIPILDADSGSSAPFTGSYAVISTNALEFTVHSADTSYGPYVLPVYRDSAGRVTQVLLTPLAVIADLTIVGGYVFLQAWANGGFQFSD